MATSLVQWRTWWLQKQNISSTKSPGMAFVLNIRRFIRARNEQTGRSWRIVSNKHPTFEGLLVGSHSFYFSESSSIGTSSKSQTHQSFKLQHCAHLAESYPILLFLRKVVVGSSQIHSTRNIGSTHVAREKGRVVTFLLMFRPLSGCPWCGWKFGASHGKFWN